MNPEMLYRRALAAYGNGDLAGSERLCSEVLLREPGNIDARYLLALSIFQQGQTAAALAHIEIALAADPGDIRTMALHGAVLQTGGRFDEALNVYETILAVAPREVEVWSNRGGVLQSQGRFGEALESFDRALAGQPDHAGALYNRGNALRALNRHQEALASFDRAIALMPHYAEAHNNRAIVLQSLDRLDEALAGFNTALVIAPTHVEALYNRGLVLGDLNRPNEALTSFSTAVAVKPDYAEAWNKCGVTLQGLKRFDEALACYRRALSLQPGYPEALKNIALALCESGSTTEGFAVFARHAELALGDALMAAAKAGPSLPHKLRHDVEQSAYLARETGEEVDVGGALHLVDGSRLVSAAISPDLTGREISAIWQTSKPQIVVIDNILTEEALDKLRRFCLGSTVWRKVYEGGYLGALPEYGFACPLLAQIADELRDAYPAIFAMHPMHYLWGFKYDSKMSGIALHADKAAVNVNLWITPDESNLNPERGGLVIWDVAAPHDWVFQRYNGDTEASRAFLRDNGAQSVTVPYRANRAVIFDSDLFHETDKIDFKDGYCDRRINITLLYGRRTSDNR